jgi:prolyl-tRNA editing enzyme YbaK/EbsC (Cys-tRNA(Pro) deacylase)
MTSSWPRPVDDVAAFLRDARAEARLEEFAVAAATAAEVSEAAGCELRQVVTALMFVCDGIPVAVLVPGDRRADRAKVARAVGAKEVRDAVVQADNGFPPGRGGRVLVEQTLLAEPLVWAGAGSPRHMVALAPGELVRLTRGEPMDVVEAPAYHSSPETAKD